MKTGKTTKLLAVATVATLMGATTVRADDYAPVWQYELGIGSQRSFHTFYLSYQSRDGGYVGLADLDRQRSMRIPLYSTDPSTYTGAKLFSLLRRAADDENASIGESLGAMVGAVLVLGPPVAATVKTVKELECTPFCEKNRK